MFFDPAVNVLLIIMSPLIQTFGGTVAASGD